jgi:uncharacterized protein YegP (UPF0339 family)
MVSRRAWVMAVCFLAAGSVGLAADGKLAFEIYPDAKGEYRWRLKEDDKVVGTSGQGYKEKRDAKKMVENFKADITKYTFETYEDAKGATRWRIKAKNGQTVGSSSGGYKAKADAEKAIEGIKAGAKAATVSEVAGEK